MTDDINNNDSDIRMRNGSMYELHLGNVLADSLRREIDMIADELAQKVGKSWLADHDRRLLEEYEAFALKCYNSDDMGIMSLDDVITAFLAQREGE